MLPLKYAELLSSKAQHFNFNPRGILRPKPPSNIHFLPKCMALCLTLGCHCELEVWLSVINIKVKLLLSYASIFDACMISLSSPGVQLTWVVLWQCSASCGKGDRARYVSCRDAHGGIADESFCAHLPRPAEVSSCFSPCGEWQVGNWSPVSIAQIVVLFLNV